jgi:hypothetical protein
MYPEGYLEMATVLVMLDMAERGTAARFLDQEDGGPTFSSPETRRTN